MPGLRRPVGSPGPVPGLRWLLDFSVAGSDRKTVEAWTPLPTGCGSQADRPNAASIRPSWPGCWPSNGSQVASWRSPSWISRSRRPGRSVGHCTVRFLGVGGSRPLSSRGGLSKLRRSVGSWRVGADRLISSSRWTVGSISASPGSRPSGVWMSWSGPGWSPSVGRQVGLRMLQSWTLSRVMVDTSGG
jgi:hypothetical protein